MKKPVAAITAVSLAILLTGCSNQKADSALTALKKLQAKTEVGVTLGDYSTSLGEARYAVDEYLRDNPVNPNATGGFAYDLTQSLKYYDDAGDALREMAMDNSYGLCDRHADICAEYPELVHDQDNRISHGAYTNKALARAEWKNADDHLEKAIAEEPK